MIVVDSMYQMAMVHAAVGGNQPQASSGDSARQYSIAVVVTNGVVVDRKPNHPTNNKFTLASGTSSATKTTPQSSQTTTYKAALGEAWHHVAIGMPCSERPKPRPL